MDWIEQKKVLNSMGYSNYKDYLSGVVWANIREKVLELHNNKCTICGRNATAIHHREYTEEVFRGTDITPLEPLCWDCHSRI
jgi:5-methylcytosine-specific restriction endonuclease McrA